MSLLPAGEETNDFLSTDDDDDVATPVKNDQMVSGTGGGRIGTKSVNGCVTCSPPLSFYLSAK